MNLLYAFLLSCKLLIVDPITHEKLVGVQITVNNQTYYTNLEGEVVVEAGNCVINYISYQDVIVNVQTDTTIYLLQRK